jgi:hypothetical protein
MVYIILLYVYSYKSKSKLIQMVLYATVIPFNSIETERYDLSHEILKVLINTLELVFISYSLKLKHSFQEKETGTKVLSVALAWTFAETICSNLLYFIMNATGEEFQWEYIQTAIQTNFDLIERIAVVALLECYYRKTTFSFFYLALVLARYFVVGLGFKYLDILKHHDEWRQLMIKGGFSLGFAIVSR